MGFSKWLSRWAVFGLVIGCQPAAPAPSLQPPVPVDKAAPAAPADNAPNANAAHYGPHGVAATPSPVNADPAAKPEATPGAQPSAEAPPLAVPAGGEQAAADEMRGHPCQCGKTCHCGHCSGAVPGCHCHVKRADGKEAE